MSGITYNVESYTKEDGDPWDLQQEENHSFLTIPQIRAREIIRAHVSHRQSNNVGDETAVEDFDSVIKPRLMSEVDSLTEGEADAASVQKYYKHLASSAGSNLQAQLARDGWSWQIHCNTFSASRTNLKTSRLKAQCEPVGWACAFSESPGPHDCYSRFFFQNFLEQVVIPSSNRSARSGMNATHEAKTWNDLDINEFMIWIGILESMQIAETPAGCIQEYWQPKSFAFGAISFRFNFSKYMSHHRWLQILQHLTFDGDVLELFDAFNQSMEKAFIPGRALSVCELSRFKLNPSDSVKEWMCISDWSTKIIMRLPSSPSKVRHWSEQFHDPTTILLLGLTQPYQFSFREAYVAASQCESDALIQLHKRGIDTIVLSDHASDELPPFYPVDALRVMLPSSNSCVVCDRSVGGKNVRIVIQQRVSCAFCPNDFSSRDSQHCFSVSNECSNTMKAISQFKFLVDSHIKMFIKPIQQALADISHIENFEKINVLVWLLAIVEYNAKRAFDMISPETETSLSRFRAQLANQLLSDCSSPQLFDRTSILGTVESRKRRIAEVHRAVRLDNSSAQVQRQCSLAHECANKKRDTDSAPRTSNACSCSPSVPLCSKVCHTHHVLTQLDSFFDVEGHDSE
jgi:hypothetical protein